MIKHMLFSILYGHINVPLAEKELSALNSPPKRLFYSPMKVFLMVSYTCTGHSLH